MRLNSPKAWLKACMAGAAAVAVLGFAGYGLLRGYKAWKVGRLVDQARVQLAHGEVRGALLCLQQAIRKDPAHAGAFRLMGDLAEAAGSPVALSYRTRVVELEPLNLTNRLALVQTALATGDAGTAAASLAAAPAAARASAAFQRAAMSVALATNAVAAGEVHGREAVRLEPTNALYRLALATLELRSTNASVAHRARATLEQLRAEPAARAEALRQLLLDSLQQKATNRALVLGSELEADPHAQFSDRLWHLGVVRMGKPQEAGPRLQALQAGAATNGLQAVQLARWMFKNGMARETLAWIGTLATNVQSSMPVALVAADCQIATDDWAGLESRLRPQNWGEMDYFRQAILTRVARQLGQTAAADAAWRRSVAQAGGRLERLTHLARVAGEWHWTREFDDVSWAVFELTPQDGAVFGYLYGRMLAQGNTAGVRRLFQRRHNAAPADPIAKNNLAMILLLVDGRDARGHQLAREVFQSAPKDPAFVSTYAYSLHLQQQTSEALRLMAGLEAQRLEDPAVAIYYGVMLAERGDLQAARKYLGRVETARLLPEERELVRRAQARLSAAS